MDQKCRGKRNVVRNEKWLRDMYRELRIRASVSTCPPIQSRAGPDDAPMAATTVASCTDEIMALSDIEQ